MKAQLNRQNDRMIAKLQTNSIKLKMTSWEQNWCIYTTVLVENGGSLKQLSTWFLQLSLGNSGKKVVMVFYQT